MADESGNPIKPTTPAASSSSSEFHLTAEEIAVYKWQYGNQGSFFTNLWKLICSADGHNLSRLEKAFPDEVKGYRKYGNERGFVYQMEQKWRAKLEIEKIDNTKRLELPLLIGEIKSDLGIRYLEMKLKSNKS